MENLDRVEFAIAFKRRTQKFAVDNIKFFRTLPKTEEAKIIGRQLLRSSTSVGANYRAACRARSKAEFHSKLSIVVEESDESVFWMEVLIDAGIADPTSLKDLLQEANEILKVVSASRKTVSLNKQKINNSIIQ
jgi:four helix bundle protein